MVEGNRDKLKKSYNSLASLYDRERFTDSAGMFLSYVDSYIIKKLFSQVNAKTILDVPVGTGRGLDYLKGKFEYALGIDYSEPMLVQAKKKKVPSLQLIRADASRLPIRTGTVECLMSLRFFHLFSQNERMFFAREFRRVVKPGGFVICSVDNPYYGLALGLIRKKIGKYGPQFTRKSELQALFPGWRQVASLGNFLPLQRLTRKFGKSLSDKLVEVISSNIILKNLCFEIFYLLQKPARK